MFTTKLCLSQNGNSLLHIKYLLLIEDIIVGVDSLNFPNSIVGLVLCEGSLLFEQGDVERTNITIFLIQDLQVVAKIKKKDYYYHCGKV